jgi:hypothetical protein
MRCFVFVVVSAGAGHVLMLFGFLFENLWLAQAALGWEVPNIVDDVPHLFILQNPFPPRHSRRLDSVFDDPLQLAVGVILHVFD